MSRSKNVHVVNWRALLGLLVQSQQTLPEVQSQPIRRIVIHPLYNRRTKQADVAMMQLEQPISFSGQSHDTTQASSFSGHDINGFLMAFVRPVFKEV